MIIQLIDLGNGINRGTNPWGSGGKTSGTESRTEKHSWLNSIDPRERVAIHVESAQLASFVLFAQFELEHEGPCLTRPVNQEFETLSGAKSSPSSYFAVSCRLTH